MRDCEHSASGHKKVLKGFCCRENLFVLFDLILYVPVNSFQSCWDGSSWVEPVLSRD